jgi:ribosomal protein L11 methyltransferase
LLLQARAEDFIACRADLVIANIHYDVMKRLICPEAFSGKKWLILSGLLRSEARDIVFRLSQHPVRIVTRQEHEGIWHTFLVKVED